MMNDETGLQRFVVAQNTSYEKALSEINNGRKQTHWMWFIFPQLKGLGFSDTAQFYGIDGMEEATDYLAHPVLGNRLIEISEAVLAVDGKSANEIFGSPDDSKLHSCMTLFATISKNEVFRKIIEKYYNGVEDKRTLQMLGKIK